ncbi:MAG TPA: penicillin-binding protein 2, partial [Planctomycetota bacterium]|nr:penicillin-binding protein 2 [Planctomycetota bacterium]
MARDARLVLAMTGLLLAALAGLGARLYWVQIASNPHYETLRRAQSTGRLDLTESRCDINDATGTPFAASEAVDSVAVVPEEIREPAALAPRLAVLLGLPVETVYETLTAATAEGRLRKFAWLKRKVSADEAGAVRGLKAPGILLEREYKRRYPLGTMLSHVLGHVDIDEKGLEGIEFVAEPYLAQLRDSAIVQRDARRQVVIRPQQDSPTPLRGNLYLTIDVAFQRIVDEELRKAWDEFRPKWACAVALDPMTGEVLAWCVLPDFDPNRAGAASADSRRNRALTDPYEPGSVLKPLIVAAALERGVVTPDETFDCQHGTFRHGGRTVHDHKPFGTLTVTEIIANSSNIGACKIALRMGPEGVHGALTAFGLNSRTGIDLPGENPGHVKPWAKWSAYTLTSAPIGYELFVTPVQLARAFSAIANGGYLIRPRLIGEVLDEEGYLVHRPPVTGPPRVVSAETAAKVRAMLEETVERGTGKEARV